MKKFINRYTALYTGITLISSISQLFLNIEKDFVSQNIHLVDRALVILLITTLLHLVDSRKFKNNIQKYFILYLIAVIGSLIYVFISGFLISLHPNAYRDLTLNVLIGLSIYLIVRNIIRKLLLRK